MEDINRVVGINEEQPAGFLLRFGALLIDGFLFVPLYILIGYLVTPDAGLLPVRLSFAANILLLLLWWGYNIFFLWKYQATLGKRFLGIKIIDNEGRTPNLKSIIIRETIGKIVSGIVFNLGYLWVIFNKHKLAWHDKIAHTRAVKVRHLPLWRKVVLFALLLLIFLIPIFSGLFLTTKKPRHQLDQAADAKRRADVAEIVSTARQFCLEKGRCPSNLQELQRTGYLKQIPRDPATHREYFYRPRLNNRNCVVQATLSTHKTIVRFCFSTASLSPTP